MFGTSGVRGPVGETVTADLALAVGRALGVDADRVVLGRDARQSGRFLADAVAAGCAESGTDVVDLGLAATPTIARAVGWEDADAGVAVTASHNPSPDNGLKLWQPSGQAFDADRRAQIAERVREDAFEPAAWDETGHRERLASPADERTRAHRRHVRAILDALGRVDADASGADPSSALADFDGDGPSSALADAGAGDPSAVLADAAPVAVDLGNGVGGVTVDALGRLGAGVETLNAQPDGAFPGRPSEPTAANLSSLGALVAETDARLGLAHDGDADRLRAVTADGTVVSGDALLAVFAREVAGPGDRVAVPVDTSLAVADHLAEIDVAVEYTPVGDVFVAAAATEPDVAFGGEPSGAWIWPEETLCPDGPLAACRLAALDAARPLGERVADVPDYPIHRDSVDVAEKTAAMERVLDLATSRYDEVSTADGARVDLGDAWFLVRASGTQPLIRLTAEAREADRAAAALETARGLLEDAIDAV